MSRRLSRGVNVEDQIRGPIDAQICLRYTSGSHQVCYRREPPAKPIYRSHRDLSTTIIFYLIT